MGTIVERPRKKSGKAYMAKIILKREGKVIHRETETFDRRPAAAAWMVPPREDALSKPGAIERAKLATNDSPLSPLDYAAMKDAQEVLRRAPISSRSNHIAFENDGQMRHKAGIPGSDDRGEGTAL
jgi:hypothetical protein